MVKRIVCLALCALLTLSMLAGCSTSASSLTTKEYKCQELTITVPTTMRDVSFKSEFASYTFTLDSSTIAVFGIKEPFTDFDMGSDLTLDEYAKAFIHANQMDLTAIDRSNADYKYFRYTADEFKYLGGIYKGTTGFWVVQFAAEPANYNETAFFEYLDSVKFS